MRHNPANAAWPNRDRFVLSCGHASMLLYSMLYLCGYGLELDDLENFRQLGSPCAGHPEYGARARHRGDDRSARPGHLHTASASRSPSACSPPASTAPGHEIVDHHTFTIASDGDLEEGISVRGRLARRPPRPRPADRLLRRQPHLDRGRHRRSPSARTSARATRPTAGTSSTSARTSRSSASRRPRGRRWRSTDRPSLIICRTHIALGSPNKQDTAGAHGSPLGEEEVRLTKEVYGWPTEPPFFVPAEALAHCRETIARGEALEREWDDALRRLPRRPPRAGR